MKKAHPRNCQCDTCCELRSSQLPRLSAAQAKLYATLTRDRATPSITATADCDQDTLVLNRSTTDPLRLNATREAYRKTMQLRFDRIASLCRTSINKGALEVQQSNQGARAGSPAPPGSWSGPADIAIAYFQSWLASQTTSVVLDSENTVEQGPPRGHFTRTFTARAYLAGLTRAAEEARRLALPNVPDLDTLLGTPRSTSAREILARRQYQLLIGITDDMAENMRKVMAEGFELGYERQQFVDALVKQAGLSKTRADALAVTEVTYANAEATLNAYADIGIQRVTALVEFQTTSGNPCPECLALEGQIFVIQDARNIIPVHVRCQCVWLPVEEQPVRRAA